MTSKRISLMSPLMHCVNLALVGALVFLVLDAYLSSPAGSSFDRSLHYIFKELHEQGRVLYTLIALMLASLVLRPSPQKSGR